ncbi:hypothetical protein [Opitutus sp. ER46]|uniref:hypothetical protein n=1 Tax=Opitutus sp. ER46 TaxID=2161864 RepID=UPI000D31F9E4|nr:hypothetical protein [Opitutus sp. ER46]PTX95522.1 hypothetical protein DB354_08855 [Opitutus sp. ER46]
MLLSTNMPADRSVQFHLSRSGLWILSLLLLAPWILLAGWILHGRARHATAPASPPVATAPAASGDVQAGHPGPWGQLEYARILLEPPEEFVADDAAQDGIRPWLFKGYSDAMLATLADAAHLTSAQREFLTAPTHRESHPEGILLHPEADFIIGLSPDSRAHLYAVLAQWPENFSQANPFRLRIQDAPHWLDQAELPESVVTLTQQLFYSRGNVMCFADDRIVLPMLTSAAQRTRYIKTLARKSALMVQLRILPGQDVSAIAEYWGRGGRSKDLTPLLQSLARRPQGGSIDIVHLLPRFARQHVYTYPLPSDRPADANHDCHWTSLNFANADPDERFADIDVVRQTILDQYYPVYGEPRLGDLIMFVRPDSVVIHSCVYLADDLVFTKNGAAFSIPWIISPLSDVQAFYADLPNIEIRRFRPKGQ